MDFLAHISEDRVRSQLLIDHLSGTAKMAAEFATPLGMAERAFRCGLAHDIGKYSLGNTVQFTADALMERLRASFPSFVTKILRIGSTTRAFFCLD